MLKMSRKKIVKDSEELSMDLIYVVFEIFVSNTDGIMSIPPVPEVPALRKLLTPPIAIAQKLLRRKSIKEKKFLTVICKPQKVKMLTKIFIGKLGLDELFLYPIFYLIHMDWQYQGLYIYIYIYIVSTVLYLSLLRGLVACLTIPCLSYCISLAIKPSFFHLQTCWLSLHTSTALSDCIPFKYITVVLQDLSIYLFFHFLCVLLNGRPGWQRPLSGRFFFF